jgi:hypothetical protein
MIAELYAKLENISNDQLRAIIFALKTGNPEVAYSALGIKIEEIEDQIRYVQHTRLVNELLEELFKE